MNYFNCDGNGNGNGNGNRVVIWFNFNIRVARVERILSSQNDISKMHINSFNDSSQTRNCFKELLAIVAIL